MAIDGENIRFYLHWSSLIISFISWRTLLWRLWTWHCCTGQVTQASFSILPIWDLQDHQYPKDVHLHTARRKPSRYASH
jgi:hypothetical protein